MHPSSLLFLANSISLAREAAWNPVDVNLSPATREEQHSTPAREKHPVPRVPRIWRIDEPPTPLEDIHLMVSVKSKHHNKAESRHSRSPTVFPYPLIWFENANASTLTETHASRILELWLPWWVLKCEVLDTKKRVWPTWHSQPGPSLPHLLQHCRSQHCFGLLQQIQMFQGPNCFTRKSQSNCQHTLLAA